MIAFHVNKKLYTSDIDPETPLLWFLRDQLGLTGTKFSCGISKCGSCMVHINGEAVTSCTMPISAVAGKNVTTIEGLSADKGELHPAQQAWLNEDVAECGYCQSGQIMAASALLGRLANPSDKDIDEAMSKVLCRCGTYQRIRKAIKKAAKSEIKSKSIEQ